MHSSSQIHEQRSTCLPSHTWVGETEVIKTATFGGQQMTAMQWSEDGSEYALIYLGQTSTGYESLTQAQVAASSFAISVLAKMSESISAVA